MTLEDATAWAERALQAGDFAELERAIQARHTAIRLALASSPTPPDAVAQAFTAGERICAALKALKRELSLESARLRRIQDGFSSSPPPSSRLTLRA
jgi:hypothetical protein